MARTATNVQHGAFAPREPCDALRDANVQIVITKWPKSSPGGSAVESALRHSKGPVSVLSPFAEPPHFGWAPQILRAYSGYSPPPAGRIQTVAKRQRLVRKLAEHLTQHTPNGMLARVGGRRHLQDRMRPKLLRASIMRRKDETHVVGMYSPAPKDTTQS